MDAMEKSLSENITILLDVGSNNYNRNRIFNSFCKGN